MTAFTVVSAFQADMENLPDYDLAAEATFATRDQAEAHAEALNESEGHTWRFWVLTAEELAAVA